MVRLILVTFAFLAWGFYVMSGGADFDPDQARAAEASSDPLEQMTSRNEPPDSAQADDIEVTRVSLDLTSVEDALAGKDGNGRSARLPQQRTESLETTVAPGRASDDETIARAIESAIDAAEPNLIIPSLVARASPATDDAVFGDVVDAGSNVRTVTGSRVNVRGGPGTSYEVVGKLDEGDRVEILEDSGGGWVRMRPTDGGTVGWMADFLLSDG